MMAAREELRAVCSGEITLGGVGGGKAKRLVSSVVVWAKRVCQERRRRSREATARLLPLCRDGGRCPSYSRACHREGGSAERR